MGIGTTIAVSGLGVSALRLVQTLDKETSTDKKILNQDKVHTVEGVDNVSSVRGKTVNPTQRSNIFASINLLQEDVADIELVTPKAIKSYQSAQKALSIEGLEYSGA